MKRSRAVKKAGRTVRNRGADAARRPKVKRLPRAALKKYKELLLKDSRVAPHLTEKQLDRLLDPAKYTGLAARFVDRVTGK